MSVRVNTRFTPPSAHAPCIIAPAKTEAHPDYSIAVDLQLNVDQIPLLDHHSQVN